MNGCPNADPYGLCACGPDCYYRALLAAQPLTGWRCPNCGAGNAPTVLQCPCALPEWNVWPDGTIRSAMQ